MLDAQVQLGLTYYTLGRAADALERWQAVSNLDPERDDARMYMRLVQSKIKARSEADGSDGDPER